ncbi:MAG: hypothetical protein H6618_08710 [Deltaproteobacteria bacterium]|nr:hypothetical protein [Deltaproteobacteria bacterium]
MKMILVWVFLLCVLPINTALGSCLSEKLKELRQAYSEQQYIRLRPAKKIRDRLNQRFEELITEGNYEEINRVLPELWELQRLFRYKSEKSSDQMLQMPVPGTSREFELSRESHEASEELVSFFDEQIEKLARGIPLNWRNPGSFPLTLLALAADDVYEVPDDLRQVVADDWRHKLEDGHYIYGDRYDEGYDGDAMDVYQRLNRHHGGSHSYKTSRSLSQMSFECLDFSNSDGSLLIRLYRNKVNRIGIIAVRGTDNQENQKADLALAIASMQRGEDVIAETLNRAVPGDDWVSVLIKLGAVFGGAYAYQNYGCQDIQNKSERWARSVSDCASWKEFFKGIPKIYVTGHSLGGYLAQVIAIKQNWGGIAINSPYLAISYGEDFSKYTGEFYYHRVIDDQVSRVIESTQKRLGKTHFHYYHSGENHFEKHSISAFLTILGL